MSQPIGIYITEQSGDKVTGHYTSKKGGRIVVHTFTDCTLDWVKAEASRVIHEPVVHFLTPEHWFEPVDDTPVERVRRKHNRRLSFVESSDQELEDERLAFAQKSDELPCDSCGEPVGLDEFCGYEKPNGDSELLCPDCFVNETQTGPTQ